MSIQRDGWKKSDRKQTPTKTAMIAFLSADPLRSVDALQQPGPQISCSKNTLADYAKLTAFLKISETSGTVTTTNLAVRHDHEQPIRIAQR